MTWKQSLFIRIVNAISTLAIPFMLSVFPLYAMLLAGEGVRGIL